MLFGTQLHTQQAQESGTLMQEVGPELEEPWSPGSPASRGVTESELGPCPQRIWLLLHCPLPSLKQSTSSRPP